MKTIDNLDRQLLRLVQKDALMSTESLGMQVNLSATAAKRRINKLRKNQTITKDVSIVDPKKLGFEILALVQVTLERGRHDIVHGFKIAIKEHSRILQGFYTAGDVDFVLLVVSKSLEEYDQFTHEFFMENSHVKWFKTTVVMDNVKLGLELPV